jgi:NAD(P)-dependent dehydrogenase (short-subunit alcohol dehydrogenase family)
VAPPAIDGLRVIVTGAASGMGEAALRLFVREGARVAALDVQDQLGTSAVAAANERGPGHAAYRHCDVRDRHEVQTAFQAAVEGLGGMDALVHCAGVDRIAAAESITEAEWDLVLDINLKGTFLTNQAAFAHLRDRGGRIVNFASPAGLTMARYGHGHYVASKAGVIAWSRSVAAEWGRYGINVNSFLPFAQTPMIDALRAALGEEGSRAFDAGVSATPLGRLGDPDADIAPVLLFLLTDAARYITGQMIAVDGGTVPLR